MSGMIILKLLLIILIQIRFINLLNINKFIILNLYKLKGGIYMKNFTLKMISIFSLFALLTTTSFAQTNIRIEPKEFLDHRPCAESQKFEGLEKEVYDVWNTDIYGNVINSISKSSFRSDGLTYIFSGIELDNTKTDHYKYFLGEKRYENFTSKKVPLKYSQTNRKESEFSVGGEFSLKADFGVKFIAKLEGELKISCQKKWITASSSVIEAGPVDVDPGTGQSFMKYRTGGYGKGSVRYERRSSGGTFLGYTYAGGSGWAPSEITTIKHTEWNLPNS